MTTFSSVVLFSDFLLFRHLLHSCQNMSVKCSKIKCLLKRKHFKKQLNKHIEHLYMRQHLLMLNDNIDVASKEEAISIPSVLNTDPPVLHPVQFLRCIHCVLGNGTGGKIRRMA